MGAQKGHSGAPPDRGRSNTDTQNTGATPGGTRASTADKEEGTASHGWSAPDGLPLLLRKQPIWDVGDTPHLMLVEQGLPWHPVVMGLSGQAIPFIVAATHADALPSAPFWFPVPAVLVASPALKGHMVDGRDSAWRNRAPGPHAHRNTARQAMDGRWTEARGQQKQSNDPGNNQHILNTPIAWRR